MRIYEFEKTAGQDMFLMKMKDLLVEITVIKKEVCHKREN